MVGVLVMKQKKSKIERVAAIAADDALKAQAEKGAKSDNYKRLIAEALDSTKSHDFISRMDECGDDNGWGKPKKCGSPYCIRCFPEMVGNQKALMAKALNRYATEAGQRANLKWVTILFAVFGFDLLSQKYPTFPVDTAKDAKENLATKEMAALDKIFPNPVWLGGYSWEAVRPDIASPYKHATIKALAATTSAAGIAAPAPPEIFAHPMDCWRNHLITFHAHLVVDLAGTDEKAFHTYCHGKWGMGRSVPRGVLIMPLVKNKAVPDSLETLAVYPYLNQWIYKQSKADKQAKVSPNPLEPEILSAMVSGLTRLKQSIRTNHKWK